MGFNALIVDKAEDGAISQSIQEIEVDRLPDGEVLVGTTTGYQPGRPGFFLVPADGDANIERCYVVTAATKDVGFL